MLAWSGSSGSRGWQSWDRPMTHVVRSSNRNTRPVCGPPQIVSVTLAGIGRPLPLLGGGRYVAPERPHEPLAIRPGVVQWIARGPVRRFDLQDPLRPQEGAAPTA